MQRPNGRRLRQGAEDMTAISWNGVDSDWDLAADWSTGAVPDLGR